MTDHAMIIDSGVFADSWADVERIQDVMTQAECARAFRLFAIKMATTYLTGNPDPNQPIYNMRAALKYALEEAGDLTSRNSYTPPKKTADGHDVWENEPPF